MKRFIILSLVAIGALASLACGPSPRPHYYVFSVFPRSQWNDVAQDKINQYWIDYTGGEAEDWEVEGLKDVDLKDFNKSENTIIETAIKKKDQETLTYLRRLITYLQASETLTRDKWNYPTKEEIAAAKKKLQNVKGVSAAYTGTNYKSQYALLVMRCNLLLGFDKANSTYWSTTAYRLPKDCYRDRMKGIFAHALLAEGRRADAIKLYAGIGDMTSLKWLVKDQRNLAGIKKEYTDDPNSATLVFLVQDFVNNAQETKDINNKELMKEVEATAIYDKEIRDFIAFAKNVVAEGKTESPAMWQAAAGYLTGMLGNTQEAKSMLDQAMTMKGTQRMLDNARACRFAVSTQSMTTSAQDKAYMLSELKWLKEMSKTDSHYEELIERFVFEELVPNFKKQNETNLATSLVGFAFSCEPPISITYISSYVTSPDGTTPNCVFENDTTFDAAYFAALDSLTAQETINYCSYLNSKSNDELESWLISNIEQKITDNQYNDMLGTKYMREGKFSQAIPYLEKVPLTYISNQGISRYMAKRTYNKERWFVHQTVDYYDSDNTDKSEVKVNQKLTFCREMVKLDNDYAADSNNPAYQYKKAALLYQASWKGDCWYLTRYANSVHDQFGYKNECNFVKEAVNLLASAKKSSDFDLQQKALYALAFIPQGEDLLYQDWSKKKNDCVWMVNKNTPQYGAMQDLLNFYKANPTTVASYISHCDVLKQFRTLKTGKKKTTSKKSRRS